MRGDKTPAERVQESSEAAIRDAKFRMDDAVEHYQEAHQLGATQLASTELNRAVLSLYWRMLPHLERRKGWENASDLQCVDGDVLWQGYHPKIGGDVTIEGFKDVQYWLNGSVTVERKLDGPKYGTESVTETVPTLLPASAALTIARALNRRYKDFGWAAKTATQDIDDGGVV